MGRAARRHGRLPRQGAAWPPSSAPAAAPRPRTRSRCRRRNAVWPEAVPRASPAAPMPASASRSANRPRARVALPGAVRREQVQAFGIGDLGHQVDRLVAGAHQVEAACRTDQVQAAVAAECARPEHGDQFAVAGPARGAAPEEPKQQIDRTEHRGQHHDHAHEVAGGHHARGAGGAGAAGSGQRSRVDRRRLDRGRCRCGSCAHTEPAANSNPPAISSAGTVMTRAARASSQRRRLVRCAGLFPSQERSLAFFGAPKCESSSGTVCATAGSRQTPRTGAIPSPSPTPESPSPGWRSCRPTPPPVRERRAGCRSRSPPAHR